MRLESTKWAMIALPLASIAYGWLCQKKVHVAAVCVALFLSGFLSMYVFLVWSNGWGSHTLLCSWIYSSTLAYIVDANTGRSTTAVACNSCFRGAFAFVSAEVAAPLQDAIGDGGLYSLWGGLMVVVGILMMLLIWKGKEWRERDVSRGNEK